MWYPINFVYSERTGPKRLGCGHARPKTRSLWRMQSAASNLPNFKTPLSLQPKMASYLEFRHLLFITVFPKVVIRQP